MSAREKPAAAARISVETSRQLRTLAHDLANSIETIMQATYLLSQMQLGEDAKKWTELVDKAARDCARINREIREVVRANS